MITRGSQYTSLHCIAYMTVLIHFSRTNCNVPIHFHTTSDHTGAVVTTCVKVRRFRTILLLPRLGRNSGNRVGGRENRVDCSQNITRFQPSFCCFCPAWEAVRKNDVIDGSGHYGTFLLPTLSTEIRKLNLHLFNLGQSFRNCTWYRYAIYLHLTHM